ncbi:MAG TPA: UvrD-helicase domain-containing protein, partial [Candidatus Dormibacteraeota bacterium]
MEAITAEDGPLGIIAGPGCGKTTVLAGRIAFLIRERGLDPSS